MNSEGTLTFPETPNLYPKRKYIAMKECAIPYTWPTISAKFEHNILMYIIDKEEAKHMTIRNGNRDCDSLNYQMVNFF